MHAYLALHYRSDPLWAELDQTGVDAVLIRFSGGHHLGYMTAYSADSTPVLELCRHDSRLVRIHACTHESNLCAEIWSITSMTEMSILALATFHLICTPSDLTRDVLSRVQ